MKSQNKSCSGRVEKSSQVLTAAAERRRKLRGAVSVVFEKLEARQMMTAFTATGSIQTYNVTATGEYAVSASGATGGYGSYGAGVSGDVQLTAGTVLKVVVGGEGQGDLNGNGVEYAGGGGGSFVYVSGAAQPLFVAGGGGGGGSGSSTSNAQVGPNGAGGTGSYAGAGGTGGSGGQGGTAYVAGSGGGFSGGGGGGWVGSGSAPGSAKFGGGGGAPSFAAGQYESNAPGAAGADGGFGGGGSGGTYGGGGGGGYSGGGGGGGNFPSDGGGGGGSYVTPSASSATQKINEPGSGFISKGSVTISGFLLVNNQSVNVAFDTPKPITLTSQETAIPGAAVTYSITSDAARGSLNLNPKTGTVSYTPTDNYVGTDSFTFVATDGTNTSATGTVTVTVASPSSTPWMATLPDTVPLTDISLPGTTNSAAGPTLADALLGSGSVKFLNPPSLTNTATTNAALTAHLAADSASSAALAAGGNNAALNAAAVAANAAALAADAAAGITAESTGVGLALGLTADTTGVASAIASAAQAAKSAGETTVDTTAQGAGTAATTADNAADTDVSEAGVADDAGSTDDSIAGPADTASGVADEAASGSDDAAGIADTAAGVSDGAAAAGDIAAAAEGAVDPVADGVAAGLDTTATVADVSGEGLDVTATASDVAADFTDGTATGVDATAEAVNKTAEADDAAAAGPVAASTAPNTTASTDYGAAGATHSTAAASDAAAAAAFVAGSASDGFTGDSFKSFAQGLYIPDTNGANPNNTTDQNTVYDLAIAEATSHVSAAALETAAGIADSAAATANGYAAALDAAVVSAVQAAEAANHTAVGDNAAAAAAAVKADVANATAAADDEAAVASNSTAGGLDATAGTLDTTAGIADGVSAGLDTGAAIADSAALALDIIAAATIEIPLVDVGTAAAAGIADGIAAGIDATTTASDAATAVTDGLATAADVAAAPADLATDAVDSTALADDAAAATDDTAAANAESTASGADTAAAEADAALVTAIRLATEANQTADTADAAANKAGAAALAAVDSSIVADISFSGQVQTLQTTQVAQTTQTLVIADQLSAGIRSLDLRGALVNDTVNLNVGSNFTGTNLQSGLNDMTSFLSANPSETIVVSLGDETGSLNSPGGFNADLNKLLNSSDSAVSGQTYKSFVYYSSNASTTPTLGEVRGKIVFIPSSDKTWTPVADPATGLQIGWQPTEVVGTSASFVATDLGTPTTLYVNQLTPDSDTNPVADGDNTDALAQTYFSETEVSRTTGIVGIDDPAPTLINEIIAENQTPIIVTSDSDAPGVAGTLRAAILEANQMPGVNTIELAASLTGSTGNVIVLQSNLPPITNDLDLIGNPSVYINLNGYAVPAASGTTHTVTESDFPTSASQTTLTTATDTTGLYVNIEGLNYGDTAPLSVNPISITYGTPLANSQLHGTATADQNGTIVTIPGTFTFTTAAGTLLNAGNGQSEAVTFTPAANSDGYTTQTGTVIVNVAPVASAAAVANVNPVNITYGTALANGQLTGMATYVVNGKQVTVPGTFAYTAAAGTVLNAASKGQVESVTFTPTDTTDYAALATTVTVNVAQATPTVTVSPVNLIPGDVLNNAQLSGTATAVVNGTLVNVVGTFSYTQAAGVVIGAGQGQNEQVTFTPSDNTDFSSVSTTAVVNAAQTKPALPQVTVNPINITYGTALANGQLSGVATFNLGGTNVNVPGTFGFTTAGGTGLSAGTGQTEAVTFTPTDTIDYAPVATTVAVNVAQATPGLISLSPIAITYGTALANGQINGMAVAVVDGQTVNVPGAFSFTTAAGSIVGAGQGQSQAITFTPTDTTDFTTASTTEGLNVARATPTVTGVNAVSVTYGTALASGQLTGTAVATVNGLSTSVSGTFSYVTAGGTPNAGNGQTAAVLFTPTDTTDFTTASSSVSLNVTPATPTVTVTDAGGPANGSPYAATGTVTGVNGVSLGTPTFAYYLATDTALANPLGGAPSAPGRYTVAGSYAAGGNYAAGVALTGFTINNGTAPVGATIATAAQPATANVGVAIADRAAVTGANPTGVVTFRLYNNTTAAGRPLFSDTEMLVNGVATSQSYTTTSTAIGTDYWVALYSGDGANNPVTSADTADAVTIGASLMVTSTGDGPTATGNTLRDAVAYADTLGAGMHAITFDPAVFASGQTITLGSVLTLSDTAGTTTITGPAAGVTISGGGRVGLFNVNGGVTATLSELTLVDGAAAEGGAINDKGVLTIDHSLLDANAASQLGGAIIVTGSLTVVDSTFAANTAALSGGAIEDAGSVTVLDSTLSGNTAGPAGSGGAIDNGAGAYTLTVGDSIIGSNSAGFGPDVSNAVTSLGNNLVSETDGSTGWTPSDLTGTAASPLSARLAPLAANGGPTQTLALLSGSPAIGAGAPLAGVTTDQRGVARPATNPDIGAYQTGGVPVVTVTDPGGTYNGTPFPATAANATNQGLNDSTLADFTFVYIGTGGTNYPASATAPTDAGTYTVTATYTGTAAAQASSAATAFTIARAASTAAVNFADGVYNGSPIPATGSVTGVNGPIAGASLTFTYYAASDISFANPLSATPTNAGDYVAVGIYNGGTDYAPSRAFNDLFITPANTSIALTSSTGGTSHVGQTVTIKAVVSAIAPGGSTPIGSVQFFCNGISLGTVTLIGGTASLTTSALSVGSNSIVATYVPTGGNFNAKKGVITQTVSAAPILPSSKSSGIFTVLDVANPIAITAAVAVDAASTPVIAATDIGPEPASATQLVAKASIVGATVTNVQIVQSSGSDPLVSHATSTPGDSVSQNPAAAPIVSRRFAKRATLIRVSQGGF